MELNGRAASRRSVVNGSARPAISLLLVTAAACFATAPVVSAQTPEAAAWVTVHQQVDVEMGAGNGSADVGIRFELATQEPGAALPLDVPVTFEMLGFGDAIADEMSVRGGERVVLWPTVGSHRVASLRLGEADVDAGVASLVVSYRVADVLESPGQVVHARVPLLTGPPVRAETGGDAFQASISVPDDWVVTEGFPSGLRPAGSGGHVVSLSVVPSIVGFRARTDGTWRPGFPLLVDLLTVLILVTFAAFGWRHLRSIAA
ncbi:MAG: hypothetical protein HKN72_12715 [Gemmatimonadetes bacterium]|nr:hypothetical protein [Gemmatimonadota bacterium]